MKAKDNPIARVLAKTLGMSGYKKRGNSWYRDNAEVLEVVNLQRSQWGRQYYLNYALWLKGLGEPDWPKEYTCHIQMREGAISKDEQQIRKLLDLETLQPDPERESEIARFIVDEFLPFAEKCRTLSGVCALYKEGRFGQVMVAAEARNLLSALTHSKEP